MIYVVLCFLSALLWGSFIGAKMRRGYPADKVHLPQGHAVLGSLLFTLPVVTMFFFSPLSYAGMIVAGVFALAGLGIGIRIGITTYWID